MVEGVINSDMSIIDLGCGEGRFEVLFSHKVKKILGIDRDPRKIELARNKVKEMGLSNIDFLVDDVYTLEGFESEFDIAVAHFFMAEEAVRTASKVLKPGGIFLFTCFERSHLMEIGGSRFSYSVEDVVSWLTRSGFAVDYINVEKNVVRISSKKDAIEFFGIEKVNQWKKDGKWDRVEKLLLDGSTNLTLSTFIGKTKKVI